MKNIFENSVRASRKLNLVSTEVIDSILCSLAEAVEASTEVIIAANAEDLKRMDAADPMYDRLLLNHERMSAIASDIRNVASLPSPLGIVLEESKRPNGMTITKISVPFGVIGVIYEARPNVSFDVFALCLKSANACILKGGSDAHNSNTAIINLIKGVLRQHGLDENTVTLLPADRAATKELLEAVGYVDLLIPRGSRGLIDFVRENAHVPVIETGAGICHTYIDVDADVEKGANIVLNAKTRRVGVCNALDCMVIHHERLEDLPLICNRLADKNVVIYADSAAMQALVGHYPTKLLREADENSYGTEFLSYTMSIRTVNSLNEAIEHISRYSSKHSEAIVTKNTKTAELFNRSVDAACIYVNVSTTFTDGAQFGFGAEIGISTQKLHARGPMALRELTSYKYLINGEGQTRD